MNPLARGSLEFLLAGAISLNLGGALAYGQTKNNDYIETRTRTKPFSKAQLDSIKLHEMIMPVMRDRSYDFVNKTFSINIWGKERSLRIRVKKPPEALELELFVDSTDVFDNVYLDESVVYAVHKDRSAFTVKEYSMILYPVMKHVLKYSTTTEEISEYPEEILKEGEEIVFSTLKKVVNKTTLRALFGCLDFKEFVRDVYTRDKALELGALTAKDHVYIEEFLIEPAVDFVDLPQKKLHKIRFERGEKSLDALVIFPALKADWGRIGLRKEFSPVIIKLKDF